MATAVTSNRNLNMPEDLAYSKALLKKFTHLGCPFTEGVDESWIAELIFKPGEPRLRILQWLFSKFHKKLYDMLDPSSLSLKLEPKLQRILFISSNLGLCRPDDIDLIKGNTHPKQQKAFFDKLLDMLCILETSENSQRPYYASPGKISESSALDAQFSKDCHFADILAAREGSSLCSNSVKLLPLDITKAVAESKQRRLMENLSPYPSLQSMSDKLLALEQEMAQQLSLSKSIQVEGVSYPCPPDDPQLREKLVRTTGLVLSELQQMIVSFSFCHDNHIHQWCSKGAPQLSGLGVMFKRIDCMLMKYDEILKNMELIRGSFEGIDAIISKAKDKKDTPLDQAAFVENGWKSTEGLVV